MSERLTFWDVEGVPVWVQPGVYAEAFDQMPPRRFRVASILEKGRRISDEEFVELALAQKYRDVSHLPESASVTTSTGEHSYYTCPRLGQAFVNSLNLCVRLEEAGLIPPPS